MANQFQQFLIKISQLPAEVQFFYESKSLGKALDELNKRYNITIDDLGELLDQITLADFNFNDLEKIIKIKLNFEDEIVKWTTLDYLGMIFLPIDRYLNNIDVKQEIKNRGGYLEKYQEYVDDFIEEIEDEKFKLLDQLIKKHEELVNPEEEKNATIYLFQNHLADILKEGSRGAVVNLNGGLVYLLFNKEGFKEEINKILLSSQEKLTHKEFVLDAKAHSPTVANWLKDFIKQRGSGMFDNVALADFVINSKNAKNLDEQEKKLVQKLLQLYRNLKFFPESMPTDTGEGWEIIPIDKEVETMQKARSVELPKIEQKKQEAKSI
ncbi:hypothetical protein KKA20_01795, partial [Patescibacteria group bacterium]|nr:hypothetical protein [Patescibacteria group bacterium]